jgi:hypothetical protein
LASPTEAESIVEEVILDMALFFNDRNITFAETHAREHGRRRVGHLL